MRPIYLEMQAFGPYKGKEVVDFAKLSENGIFLIKGPTGSGKTTIFDAMTIALYGGSSGDMGKGKTGRNEFGAWRCNQAEDSVNTKIVFVFAVQDCTYRFTRTIELKRKNWSETHEAEVMDENGVFTPLFENPKIADVNQKAEELIGLSREQFTKVVLLPQGQFEKFLVADSSEKEAILKKIFDTEKWERYAAGFYKRAEEKVSALSKINEKVQNSLSEEDKGFAKVDDIAVYVENQQKELEKLEQIHEEFNGVERQNRLNAERELSAKFRALRGDEKKYADLLAKADDYKNLKVSLLEAEKAEELRTLIKDAEAGEAEVTKRQNALEKLKEKLGTCEMEVKEAVKAFEDFNGLSVIEENNGKIAELRAKVPAYEKLGTLNAEMDRCNGVFYQAEQEVKKAEAELAGAVEKAAQLAAKRETAENIAADYRRRYYDGIYGEIAAEHLTEGEKCPVCGSLHHPEPACKTPDSVSKAEVEAKEKGVEAAKQNWQKAESLRESLDAAKKKAEGLYEDAQLAYTKAKAEYDAACDNIIEDIGTLDGLNRKIKEYEDSNRKLREKEEALRANKDAKEKSRVELETQISGAKTELKNAEQRRNDGLLVLIDQLKAKGYASVDAVKEKLKSDAERKQMNNDITGYETSLKDTNDRIEKARTELGEQQEPDQTTFDARQAEITNENSEYAGTTAKMKAEISKLRTKYDTLKRDVAKYEAEIAHAEEDFTFAKKLRGDSGIGLQRYVLGIMFDQVITEANSMLKKVHGGRYYLFRTDDKGKGNKKGLELKAHDNRSPEKEGRNVAMLSGGEKFLVSLALSIGMSTVAAQSGVQIDSLFIDEGFGTLDESSIQDAMEVLACVQRSNGLIGIISHVKILESTIPAVIEVVKTESGSTIKEM